MQSTQVIKCISISWDRKRMVTELWDPAQVVGIPISFFPPAFSYTPVNGYMQCFLYSSCFYSLLSSRPNDLILMDIQMDCSRGRGTRQRPSPGFFILEVGNQSDSLVTRGAICDNSWCSWWLLRRSCSIRKKVMISGRERSEKAMKKVFLPFRPLVPCDLINTQFFAAVCLMFPPVTGTIQCPWQILIFPRLIWAVVLAAID